LERLEISNSIIKESRTISNNNDIELRSLNMKKFENVNEFVFRNNGLRVLRAINFVQHFTNLKLLTLNDNLLIDIDVDAFRNLSLVEINLERNRLEKLDRQMFARSTRLHDSLKRLVLKENQLKQLSDFMFETLKNLEFLDLSRNKLSTLSDKTFSGLSSLKELSLSFNPLKNIDVNAFRYVSGSLNRLDMISNSESDWFIFDDNDICMLAYFR
jgi:Leucine-rich repeat (LRR) protein